MVAFADEPEYVQYTREAHVGDGDYDDYDARYGQYEQYKYK